MTTIIIPPSSTKLIPYTEYTFEITKGIEGYNRSTGRFGLSSQDNPNVFKEIKSISKVLEKEKELLVTVFALELGNLYICLVV